jgi:toxin FitB
VARLADPVQRRRLQAWLEDELRPRFGERVLGVDAETASIWGRTAGEAARSGRTVPTIDGLLVATARRHALTLVTRNVTDVEGLGVAGAQPVGDMKPRRWPGGVSPPDRPAPRRPAAP